MNAVVILQTVKVIYDKCSHGLLPMSYIRAPTGGDALKESLNDNRKDFKYFLKFKSFQMKIEF